jgi:hypothetical protein
MPELSGLVAKGLNQGRMRMAERVHRNPGNKIKIPAAILREEIDTLTLDEDFFRRTVDWQDVLAGIGLESVLWHRGGSGGLGKSGDRHA